MLGKALWLSILWENGSEKARLEAWRPVRRHWSRLAGLDSLEDYLGEKSWLWIRAVSQQKAIAKRPGTQEKAGRSYGFRGSSSTRRCFCQGKEFWIGWGGPEFCPFTHSVSLRSRISLTCLFLWKLGSLTTDETLRVCILRRVLWIDLTTDFIHSFLHLFSHLIIRLFIHSSIPLFFQP